MMGAASLASLALGATLAALAPRAGLGTRACETCAGVLLVSGLALLGAGMPVFR